MQGRPRQAFACPLGKQAIRALSLTRPHPLYRTRKPSAPLDASAPRSGVAVITPFNFPLEICALQTCSALFMGNQPTVKVDWKVAICMEQFIRMLHHVGLPQEYRSQSAALWEGAECHCWEVTDHAGKQPPCHPATLISLSPLAADR